MTDLSERIEGVKDISCLKTICYSHLTAEKNYIQDYRPYGLAEEISKNYFMSV